MAAARTEIIRNTTIDTVVKIIAGSTNQNTTTFLPASGFILSSGQTQTLPVSLGIKGIQCDAPGGLFIYRATGQSTADADLVFSGSGNISLQPMTGFFADYSVPTGDFTIVLTTYGTVYLHLSKLAGYSNIFTPEQTGHLAG